MNAPPVNVKVVTPKSLPNWDGEAAVWLELNRAAHGHEGFYPLTVKAAYIIGIIHDLCESVQVLLRHRGSKHTTFLPAYGIFASGVELLGRCLNGNATDRHNTHDLKTGFKWLVSTEIEAISDEQEVVRTPNGSHSVASLTSLRHFAAHGQATSRALASIDFELLTPMPAVLGEALDRYWNLLLVDEERCENLARAAVIGFRDWPVFKSWVLFQGTSGSGGETISGIFRRFDWHPPDDTIAA